MRKNILKFAYALAVLFVAAMPFGASAQFVNPGFEDGTFNGWNVNGNAFVSTGFNQNAWLVSPSGTYMSHIEPGGLTRSTAEAYLGLTPGALTAENASVFNTTTNFGAISQQIFLGAGQTVTAYWNYVSQDYAPYNDGLFASLVGPGGYEDVQLLVVTADAYGQPGVIVTGSYGSTGWQTVTFTAGAAGFYTFGFGNFNAFDQVLSPIMFTDDAAGGTTAPGQAVVTTAAASNIGTTTATTGGNVVSDGNSAVTVRGVAYSTSPLPTLADNFTTDGAGLGAFVSNLTGLSMGTTYYVRAYATNGAGTAYGNEEVFTTTACDLEATATATNVSCFGGSDGSVTVAATGGTQPYSGDGTFSGLTAGTYSYIVTDAAGCSATATATVGEPTQLVASSSATDVLCYGGNGSVTVSATGGTQPYSGDGTYTVPAGSYTYTVTDANGCTSSTSSTVNQPTALGGSISVSPNPTVTNQQQYTIFLGYGPQSVTLTAAGSGGTPGYSYSWSNSATTAATIVSPTTTTTYTVVITDANGCTYSVSQTITVKDVRNGNKIWVCHIPPGNNSNPQTISVASSAVAAHIAHGDVLGQCSNTAKSKPNDPEYQLAEFAEEMHFHVYPNPSTGIVNIELPVTGTADVMITDATGRVVYNDKVDNTDQMLKYDLGKEAKGLYFIRVNIAGEVFTSKVTLQ